MGGAVLVAVLVCAAELVDDEEPVPVPVMLGEPVPVALLAAVADTVAL